MAIMLKHYDFNVMDFSVTCDKLVTFTTKRMDIKLIHFKFISNENTKNHPVKLYKVYLWGGSKVQEMHKSRIKKSLAFSQKVFCVKILCILKRATRA